MSEIDDLEELVTSPGDLDEKARAGMTGAQSDQFIGFDKLLQGAPVGGGPRPPKTGGGKPTQARPNIAKYRARQAQFAKEQQDRINRAIAVGQAGKGQSPAFGYDDTGNLQGFRPARNVLPNQYSLPGGAEILGIDEAQLHPGDLEYLIKQLAPYRKP